MQTKPQIQPTKWSLIVGLKTGWWVPGIPHVGSESGLNSIGKNHFGLQVFQKKYIYNHFSHKSKGSSPDLCRSIAKSEKISALTRPSLHGQLGNSLLPKELLLPSVVLVCGFCNIGCFVGSVFHDPIHSDYTGRCSSPYCFFLEGCNVGA